MKIVRRSVIAVIFLLFIITSVTTPCFAQDYPKAAGYVNDFASLLTKDEGASLNQELVDFEERTGVEVAVVIIDSLGNESIEDYTKNIATEWGVGKSNLNNGIVFLVALSEREMRIEIASGAITSFSIDDANQIRDDVIIPNFKDGNMSKGVIDGTHAIMQVYEPIVSQTVANNSDTDEKTGILLIAIFGSILISFFIVAVAYAYITGKKEARSYVLSSIDEIPSLIKEATELSDNPDINSNMYEELPTIISRYTVFKQIFNSRQRIDWSSTRDEINSVIDPLKSIIFKMKTQIDFAKEARENGPGLLQSIPEMIKTVEEKTSNSNSSASDYLQQAKIQYEQVASQYPGYQNIDWLIVYAMLMNIQSDINHAESAHSQSGSSGSYSQSNDISDDSSSFGFGDIGGFDGGGGFDGSGSSGSF